MPATNDLSSGNSARRQAARLSALSRSDLVRWPITSIPGLIGTAAIEG
jgi:hypothetical protein